MASLRANNFWDNMVTIVIALSALLALSFAWSHVGDIDMYSEKKLPVNKYFAAPAVDEFHEFDLKVNSQVNCVQLGKFSFST